MCVCVCVCARARARLNVVMPDVPVTEDVGGGGGGGGDFGGETFNQSRHSHVFTAPHFIRLVLLIPKSVWMLQHPPPPPVPDLLSAAEGKINSRGEGLVLMHARSLRYLSAWSSYSGSCR